MKSNFKLYSILLLIVVLIGIILSANRTQKFRWDQTLFIDESQPFDLKVLHQELSKNKYYNAFNTVPNTYFEYRNNNDIEPDSTLLFYIGRYFDIDSISEVYLLRDVYNGADLIISASDIAENRLQFLDLSYLTAYFYNKETPIHHGFFYKEGLYDFKNIKTLSYIYGVYNSEPTEVLGYTIGPENDTLINLIRVNLGQGHIYIHTNPLAFTNVSLLYGDYQYTNEILSLSSHKNFVWLNNNSLKKSQLKEHALQFIFSNPSLKWAWYLTLIALLLFLLINSKRKQKAIPVIEPLKNTTVDFIKTVSNLYLDSKDYNSIISKRLVYFNEYIHKKYWIQHLNDKNDYLILSQKTGVDAYICRSIVNYIHLHNNQHQFIDKDVIDLDRLIGAFKYQEKTLK